MSQLLLFVIAFSSSIHAQDVNERTELAMKEATSKVAPSVVKIETSGGRELATGVAPKPKTGPAPAAPPPAGVRKGAGPTTGLVVSADGYIITSSFNFANNPSDIFVTVPGQPRLVAKVIATDTTRMLTLLKIEANNLPVPQPFPKDKMQIGLWSLALGRTLDPDITDSPSASAGIVSALGRMHGKVMQTDAKVSPVNYGGPLVALDGRVYGVLVPASPRGEGEVSGVEWYDSGIGFAVPLEDVYAVLPKLKAGQTLRRGILGITPKTPDLYLDEPVIGTISPDSAALKAGLKSGDVIVSIDGKPTPHFFAVQVALGPKYEGDTLEMVVRREGKEIAVSKVTLAGSVTSFKPGFLGVLPMRDEADPGVEVRYVYKDSPADKAGIKAGDRIMKVSVAAEGEAAPVPVLRNKAQLVSFVMGAAAGTEVKIEYKTKDGKTEKKTVKLDALSNDLPIDVPGVSSKEQAPVEKKDEKEEKKVETGLLKRKNALGREHWIYVPSSYKPNVSYGVIIWLHNKGNGGKDADDVLRIWKPMLELGNFIMIGPKSATNDGWLPSETEGILSDLKEVIANYTVDTNRIVTHGEGNGGQMAVYLGFNAREFVRGVAVTGSALGSVVKDNLPGQRIHFFLTAGDKHPDYKEIEATPKLLSEKNHPVIWRGMKDTGKEYMDTSVFKDLMMWLDTLDRI